jgi:hypothetical protein
LRFQGENPDDDENQVEHSGEEMEEEKDNVRMIAEEIRWAIGAYKGFTFTMCLLWPSFVRRVGRKTQKKLRVLPLISLFVIL